MKQDKNYVQGVCQSGDCLADAVHGTNFCTTHAEEPAKPETGQQMYERLRAISNENFNCDRDAWDDIGADEQHCWNQLFEEMSR